MAFLKKLKFWKKRKNTPTKVDACVSIEHPWTSDAATLTTDPTKVDAFVSTEDPRTSDAGTWTMDLTVMCAAYTQTETRMYVGGGAAKEKYEQLVIKNQKIRELEVELAVSKNFTADLMLDVNSVEQQVRKYAEEPVISWADDCECKKNVSAVADVLKKFINKKKDTKKSKQEATSGSNTKVDCETQTDENSSQRERANADGQETLRRLEETNRELSVLVEEYKRKIVVLNEKMEDLLQEQKSHVHQIEMKCEEEKQRHLLKMRDIREELIWYKEQLPGFRMPTGKQGPSRDISSDCKKNATDNWNTVKHTGRTHIKKPAVQQQHPIPTIENRFVLPNIQHEDSEASQNKTSDHTGRREAGGSTNSQQSENQRHRPNNCSRNRNLPPRLQNRK